MDDIIDTLNSLVERMENIRQDLRATVRDCEDLAKEIEELREAADK